MKWVTRENANVDPIVCPWLIRLFVDKNAECISAPTDQVMALARRHEDDDHEKIRLETPMYDALYAWCQKQTAKGG